MSVPVYQIVTALLGAAMLILTTHEFLRRRLSPLVYSFWAIIWLGVIATGIFPDLYAPLTRQVGLQTPVQFVTAFSVLVIFILLFQLYTRLSQIESRLTKLAQDITFEKYTPRASQPALKGHPTTMDDEK